jgi:hypothetical protein
VPLVGATLVADHVLGDAQPDVARCGAHHGAVAPSSVGDVIVEDHEVVAEEAGGFRAPMGDERLGLGKFQLEVLIQERSEVLPDGLGFVTWPREAQQEVIGVAHVAQPPVVRVLRIDDRPRRHRLAEVAGGHVVPVAAGSVPSGVESCVGRVPSPSGSTGVLRDQDLFDVLVQPVEVDVGQDRTGDASLRRAAEGPSVFPVLQVPRLQEVRDQPQEAVVVDAFTQDA